MSAYERVYCVRCGACAGSGTVEEYDTTRGPEGGKYETDCPECGGTGEQRIVKARDEAERDELLREVGRQMVQMTTTVRGEDEWLAIPELWRQCMEERDRLRSVLAQAPAPLTYPQARAAFEAWANKAHYDPTDGELRDAFLAGIEFIEGPEEET